MEKLAPSRTISDFLRNRGWLLDKPIKIDIIKSDHRERVTLRVGPTVSSPITKPLLLKGLLIFQFFSKITDKNQTVFKIIEK